MSDDIVKAFNSDDVAQKNIALRKAHDEIERLRAREAKLREALREIEWSNNSAWQSDRARAALGEEK